jgi:hypothetical protein
MSVSKHLAWPRLASLLRNEAKSLSRSWLIVSALLVGALVLVNEFVSADEIGGVVYLAWFFGALFVWGTIASSLSFTALHDKSTNAAYLLLPASALEKTLAPLLFMTIGLVVYLLVFMTVTSAGIETVNRLVSGRRNGIFDPFDRNLWQTWAIPSYIVVQSWFFLGAAWFRSAHYIKTVLAIVIGLCALVFLTAMAAWVAGFAVIDLPHVEVRPDFGYWLFLSRPWLRPLFAIIWFVVVPIFCWYLTWLRVKETQVSHGV